MLPKQLKYVYIAGPISRGDQFRNVRQAIVAAEKLRRRDFMPFVPHFSAFWHMVNENEVHYEDWLKMDFAWIDRCDAVVRLPGDSPGADREMAYAQSKGIAVFDSLEEFFAQVDKATPPKPRPGHYPWDL